MPFLKMEFGRDSISTLRPDLLGGFIESSLGENASSLWMREFKASVKKVWFTILPVGWRGEWHTSPEYQWVVPLSGRWYLKTRDGSYQEMGPGDIHWGSDVSDDPLKGHQSGQIGDDPCVLLMIQYDNTIINPDE
jgi:hypothetical protein